MTLSNAGTGVCKQGTVKRWEQVSAYVRTRAVDEVLDMVKHGLKAGRFAPKQDTFSVTKKRQVSRSNTPLDAVQGDRAAGLMSTLFPQQQKGRSGSHWLLSDSSRLCCTMRYCETGDKGNSQACL